MRKLALVPLALVVACHRRGDVPPPAAAPPPARAERAITSGEQLIEVMRDRYATTWYRNVTFIQKSTYLRPEGTPSRVETWYEAIALPGRLRIDLGEPARGNGVVYRGDSVYTVQDGRVVDRRTGRNPLLILGFDVYAQPVARTLEQLRAEHIDLDVLHADTLDGKRMYVVGAGPGDSTSNQFWVEADRLLFVRLVQTDAPRRATRDIRFAGYTPLGNAWIAADVRVLSGGRMIFREEYSDVRANVVLDEDLFIPERWSAATHWYKP